MNPFMSSTWANTFVPVIIFASPYVFSIWEQVSLVKKASIVSIPFSDASAAILLAGSIPRVLNPPDLKYYSKVPSLLPTSITRSFSRCAIE